METIYLNMHTNWIKKKRHAMPEGLVARERASDTRASLAFAIHTIALTLYASIAKWCQLQVIK